MPNVNRDEFELWINSLRDDIREGFRVTHEKQDYTNGRLREAEQDIAILKDRAERATRQSVASGAGAGAALVSAFEFVKWLWTTFAA